MKVSHCLFAVSLLLAPLAARASAPLYVSVGQVKTLNISTEVKTVSASNPELLTVKKKKSGAVQIEGKANGKSSVQMTTRTGDTVEVVVHIVSNGSTVYSTARGE
jgi:hypothetical protein